MKLSEVLKWLGNQKYQRFIQVIYKKCLSIQT